VGDGGLRLSLRLLLRSLSALGHATASECRVAKCCQLHYSCCRSCCSLAGRWSVVEQSRRRVAGDWQ
jgi:hypothetical protein